MKGTRLDIRRRVIRGLIVAVALIILVGGGTAYMSCTWTGAGGGVYQVAYIPEPPIVEHWSVRVTVQPRRLVIGSPFGDFVLYDVSEATAGDVVWRRVEEFGREVVVKQPIPAEVMEKLRERLSAEQGPLAVAALDHGYARHETWHYGDWLGWALSVCIGPMIVAFAIECALLVLVVERKGGRAVRGLCPSCGYPLSGLQDPICPECGCSTVQIMR